MVVTSGSGSAREIEPRIVLLLVVHLALATLAFARSDAADDSDLARFHQIAADSGAPWRDFEVEYAPGETAVLRLLPDDLGTLARTVVLIALAADLTIAATLRIGWGNTAARSYLLALLPLLTFLFYRLDLAVAALVVVGVYAMRRRPGIGGSILGVAILTKLWPVVVLPLVTRRHIAGLWAATAVTLGGCLAWLWWGGTGAPGQVVGFRGAEGWSVESSVGSIVWLLTGGPVQLEAGAPRTGTAALHWKIVLLVILVIAGALIVVWSATWRGEPFGLPSLGILALLLATSPLFSMQYACWLVPSAAIAWSEATHRRTPALGFLVVALTGVEFAIVQQAGGTLPTQLVVVVRNACVVATAVSASVDLARAHGDRPVSART